MTNDLLLLRQLQLKQLSTSFLDISPDLSDLGFTQPTKGQLPTSFQPRFSLVR